MKIFLSACVLCALFACDNPVPAPIATKPDFFEKKRECAEIVAKFKAKLEANSKKAEQDTITHLKSGNRNALNEFYAFHSGCYSKELNTCIASYSYVLRSKQSLKSGWVLGITTLIKEDLLTNKWVESFEYDRATETEAEKTKVNDWLGKSYSMEECVQ